MSFERDRWLADQQIITYSRIHYPRILATKPGVRGAIWIAVRGSRQMGLAETLFERGELGPEGQLLVFGGPEYEEAAWSFDTSHTVLVVIHSGFFVRLYHVDLRSIDDAKAATLSVRLALTQIPSEGAEVEPYWGPTRVQVEVRVVRPYRGHLEIAKRLAAEEDTPHNYQNSVIMAATACEMCTADTMHVYFQAMGIEHLFKPLRKFVVSFNLAGDGRLLGMYKTLTGDLSLTQDQDFWKKFRGLIETRNRIAHAAVPVGQQEAKDLCEIAELFIARVEEVGNRCSESVATPFIAVAPHAP